MPFIKKNNLKHTKVSVASGRAMFQSNQTEMYTFIATSIVSSMDRSLSPIRSRDIHISLKGSKKH